MRIDFDASDDLGVKPGDEIETTTTIRRGDLVTFERRSAEKVVFRSVGRDEAKSCRTTLYRVGKGKKSRTISLQRVVPKHTERQQVRPFSFGFFEFDEFADWILQQYDRCYSGIGATLDDYTRAVHVARLPGYDYPKAAISRAYDISYLAILALAVHYSVREDLLDGGYDPAELMSIEPVMRAAYMLNFHAKHLPVKRPKKGDASGEPSMFEKRAALVGEFLVPMAISGFEANVPHCRELKKNLPKPLQTLLKGHKHKKNPLCQFMVAAFYVAFQWFPPEGDDRYWVPLIDVFWNGWEDRVLDVYIAIGNESISDKNEVEEGDE